MELTVDLAERQPVEAATALGRIEGVAGQWLGGSRVVRGQLDLTCEPGAVTVVLDKLRATRGLEFSFFTFLTGIDRTEQVEPGGLEVLVHVYSPRHLLHANVRVPIDLEKPRCPTTSNVYAGALWHEREAAEMFGIHFDGHPRLVPLYLPEDFEGHPMRKSFRLPIRRIKEWPGAKDAGEASAGGRG